MQYTASPGSSRAQLTAPTPINDNDNVAAGELQTPDVLASRSTRFLLPVLQLATRGCPKQSFTAPPVNMSFLRGSL